MQDVSIESNIAGKQRKWDLRLPSRWNELSQAQFLFIARRWQAWQLLLRNGESMAFQKAALFLELCGLESRRKKRDLCNALSGVQGESALAVLDATNFIFDRMDLTSNLLPKIKIGIGRFLFGPDHFLSNVVIEEFSFAFTAYCNYVKSGENKDLIDLVTVLYREPGDQFHKTGEIREPFIVKRTNQRARKLRRIKPEILQAVLLYFIGCLTRLESTYPEIFRRAEESESAGGNFITCVRNMSGQEFGPYNETAQTNIHLFLPQLQERIIKARELKKEK